MSRIEPTISSFDQPEQHVALPVVRHPQGRLHNRLRVWLLILAWILAAFCAFGAVAMRAGVLPHAAWVQNQPLLLPIAAFCFVAGLLALRRGWLGVLAVGLASSTVAAYLFVSVPMISGGFLLAVFVLICSAISALSLRRATF